jgi:Big-like domain-containing protein/PKD domain-containing protein
MHVPRRPPQVGDQPARRLLLLLTLVLAMPAQAAAADLHATPSTFASTFASAQGGDRVLLASGSYGSWNGGAKGSMVTIAPEPGAKPTFSGGAFPSTVRNITIQGVTYTGPVEVRPGSTPLNLVFDGDTWGDIDRNSGGAEGRLSIIGGGQATGNGVQVKNSTFGPGGCSDGIQDSSRGTEIGPGNEFKNITQSCAAALAHADAIQPYGSNDVYIHDNYLHDNEQGIMSPDGPSAGYEITNNVIHTSTGYPCMHIGDNRDSAITHNVCLNGSIRLYGGNQGVPSQDITAQNNVAGIDNSACIGCLVSLNLGRSQVTFTGGTGRCAYATAAPKGTASDGTDIGLNDCGSAPPSPPPPSPPPPPPPPPSPPPPADVQCNDGIDNDGDGRTDFPDDPGCSSATDTTESPNPTTDHEPSARFAFSPANPVIGQPVTFDATGSTCDDTPCTYTWVDDGFDGSGGSQWPLGNGRTLSFTFRGASTKNVRVTVTDADGDTDTTLRAVAVTALPAPPPPDDPPPPPDDPPPPPDDPPPPPDSDNTPPDTTITLGPNGTINDATPTFAFTSSESDPAFECRVDSGPWVDCASPWTTVALSDGDHSVSVRSTDVAGNTDGSPATRSFTVDTAASEGRLLLGSSIVQPVADSIASGSAEAFQATASGSGSAVELSIYVDSGSTATAMIAGIYSDADGHPGTLLTKGMLSAPAPLAWNDITVPDAPLVRGQTYWLAVLGVGDGALRFRDGLGIACHSEVSRSATLTTLPTTWQTGSAWASCNISGHASA